MKKYLDWIITGLFIILSVIFIVLGVTQKGDIYVYLAGVFVGISCVAFIYTLLSRLNNCKSTYDERQIAARGKSFQYSFFVLILCLLVDGVIRSILQYDWCSYLLGVCCWCLVSIGVFVTVAIRKDAYVIEEDKTNIFYVLFAIGIMNLFITIYNIAKNQILVDGKMQSPFLNAICSLLMLYSCAVFWIHRYISKKHSEEEQE